MNAASLIRYSKLYLRRDLFQLIFHVTYRCNSRCKSCFNWKNLERGVRQELELWEIERISENLPSFPWMLVSGGEPFLRRDLFDIVRVFREQNGIEYISIPTNGILADRIYAESRKILGIDDALTVNIVFSLDGVGEVHDALRGVRGNFERVVESYHRLKSLKEEHPNLNIKFNTVVSNKNYRYVDEISDFVKTLAPDLHSFDFIRGEPRDSEVKLPGHSELVKVIERNKRNFRYYNAYKVLNRHLLSLNKVAVSIISLYFDYLIKIIEAKRRVLPCYAHKTSLVLYPYGDVSFCEMLPEIGNLRDFEYSYERVKHSDGYKKLYDKVSSGGCWCYHPCYQYTNILFNPRLIPKLFKYFKE